MCIVYDVSCKSRKHGPSLNDIECTGPSFNPFLQHISLRFRVYKYTITGDVKKSLLSNRFADEEAQRFCVNCMGFKRS